VGQPEAVVVLGILLAADPYRRRVDDAHHGGEDAGAVERATPQLPLHMCPHFWQMVRKHDQPIEVEQIPKLAPLRVVEVLLSAAVVLTGSEDVTELVGADPHVTPSGWDCQLVYAPHRPGVDRSPVRVTVAESSAAASTAQARVVGLDIPQAGHIRTAGRVVIQLADRIEQPPV